MKNPKLSTGALAAMLGTGGLAAALNAGTAQLHVYGGAIPGSADDAQSGASGLVITHTDGLLFEMNGRVLVKDSAQTAWTGDVASNFTPTHFRVMLASDDGAASTSAVRVQGTAGVSLCDMLLGTATLASGDPQEVRTFRLSIKG